MLVVVDNSIENPVAKLAHLLRYLVRSRIPYNVVKTVEEFNRVPAEYIKGIILSGSPLMVTQQSIDLHSEKFALNIAALSRYDVPILGICFGAQFINHIYGGTLRRLQKPFCENAPVDGVNACFCLHYIIDRPAPAMVVLADATIRGHRVPSLLAHPYKPLFACLFHPEVNADTHFILNNFLTMCQL